MRPKPTELSRHEADAEAWEENHERARRVQFDKFFAITDFTTIFTHESFNTNYPMEKLMAEFADLVVAFRDDFRDEFDTTWTDY